ncbi:GNAT family N-acetyltransferase [Candidatus Parcubacteria bacterium]|nr:GNAT family N-acetyltransferase [Candidatus Parcubacteria bacterium]
MEKEPKSIKLLSVSDSESEEFKEFWKIYVEAFPIDQRRPEAAQKECLSKEGFSLQLVMSKGEVAGCLSYWDLGDFIYIEHLAIEADRRGEGLGSEILGDFLGAQSKTVVLESDPPDQSDPVSLQRLAFYERLGFVQNPQQYQQSPFAEGQPAVKAVLLSYPQPISDTQEFTHVAEAITTTAHAY